MRKLSNLQNKNHSLGKTPEIPGKTMICFKGECHKCAPSWTKFTFLGVNLSSHEIHPKIESDGNFRENLLKLLVYLARQNCITVLTIFPDLALGALLCFAELNELTSEKLSEEFCFFPLLTPPKPNFASWTRNKNADKFMYMLRTPDQLTDGSGSGPSEQPDRLSSEILLYHFFLCKNFDVISIKIGLELFLYMYEH